MGQCYIQPIGLIYDTPGSRSRLRGALGPDAPRDRPAAGEGRRARDRSRPALRHVVQRRLEAREGARARRAGAAHAGRPRAPYRPRSGADPAHRGLGLPLRAVLERPPRQARGIPQSEQKGRLTMPTAGTSPTTPLLRITVPCRIEASPEEVFDAWAEPDLFRRWFEPHRAILRKAAVDELWYWEADHAGRLWAHYCRYLRVERPRLLEFTWMSEGTRGLESRVTVEMTPSRGATDLVLTHNGLPDDEMGRGHEEGWKHFTGILAEKIKGLR